MLDLKHAKAQACSTSSMLNHKPTLSLITLLYLTLCSKNQTLWSFEVQLNSSLPARLARHSLSRRAQAGSFLARWLEPKLGSLELVNFWWNFGSARSGLEICDGNLARLARARKFLWEIWLGSLEPAEFLARSTSTSNEQTSNLKGLHYMYLLNHWSNRLKHQFFKHRTDLNVFIFW